MSRHAGAVSPGFEGRPVRIANAARRYLRLGVQGAPPRHRRYLRGPGEAYFPRRPHTYIMGRICMAILEKREV